MIYPEIDEILRQNDTFRQRVKLEIDLMGAELARIKAQEILNNIEQHKSNTKD